MSQTDDLRVMIATMLMVSQAEVRPETSLATLNTSLGSARIRLGLKRLGLTAPATPAATFGGLVAAVTGESAPATPSKPVAPGRTSQAPVALNGGFGGLQVGLDVEEIRSLPVAVDYWEHEFYQGTFARSEIAYAVLQAEPRTHFAGFWCAKEALRKCDALFAGCNLNELAVAHDVDGRPYLTRVTVDGPERLQHAVSISHTAEVATAVVVTQSAPVAVAARISEKAAVAAPAPDPQTREVKRRSGLARFLGV
jgi:phosphopantetheine--protein transferase-like protein